MRHYNRGGFTLAEVMFAVLILGIGLISIAAMFPAAGAIQRNTTRELTAEEVVSNTSVQVSAMKVKLTWIDANTSGNVFESSKDSSPSNGIPDVYDWLPLEVRSAPGTSLATRQIEVMLLFRYISPGKYDVYFIPALRIEGQQPQMVYEAINPELVGEWLIFSNGTVDRNRGQAGSAWHVKSPSSQVYDGAPIVVKGIVE